MKAFRVLPESQLAEEHFDQWPVWSEHYDYEEIEDVARWGLDREEVLQLFERNSPGNEHCVYTLLEANPFPPRMRIFIKASLTLANGESVKGFVMNEDAFCLTIFHKGQQFPFSCHPMLEKLNRKQENRLRQSLGASASIELFPIKYQTAYRTAVGDAIEGSFRYGARET